MKTAFSRAPPPNTTVRVYYFARVGVRKEKLIFACELLWTHNSNSQKVHTALNCLIRKREVPTQFWYTFVYFS